MLALLLLPWTARAQAPAWSAAIIGSSTQTNGTSQTRATAVDANGNVFVTGNFTGQVAFGGNVLTSAGGNDLFVAKYVPVTATWAWAQSGGGTREDEGSGIAVSGSRVYVTGYISNNTSDANTVRFGGTGTTAGTAVQLGAASIINGQDLVVTKYTDNGSSATLGWTQVGGGRFPDWGTGIAVSGTSVYVTGQIFNSTVDDYAVRFGGSGTMAGTAVQYGANEVASQDLVVAKYTDNGSSAALNWTQVGGGYDADWGTGIAVSGTSVYVTGQITNTLNDGSSVRFGGTGTTAGTAVQYGASTTPSFDLVVAKYTDNGASATLGWTQVGGGTSTDVGYGIAVSGTSVYVAGYLSNNTTNTRGVVFGGTGPTAGTTTQYGASSSSSADLVVAKYTDNGATATLGWTQVSGGTSTDVGQGVAVSGTSVYVTGYINNNTADGNRVRFGGTGATAGTAVQLGTSGNSSDELVVAKYTDNGSSAALRWTQVGGGGTSDQGLGIAVSGTRVYVAGYIEPSATFSSFTIANPAGATTNFLGELLDAVPLPVELIAFTATAENPQAVRLAWATASEVNGAYFEVERSPNGRTFAAIGRITAAGSSTDPRRYVLLDAQLPAGTAFLYYRLRQVDADGTFSYSSVQTVAQTAVAMLQLYPNPTTGRATLSGAAPGTPVQVLDAMGRLVHTRTTDAAGMVALAVPASLPRGVYIVRAGTKALRFMLK